MKNPHGGPEQDPNGLGGQIPALDPTDALVSFKQRLGPARGEPFATLPLPAVTLHRPTPELSRPLSDVRFVALDCETTGYFPPRIVELGAVCFTLGGHIESFETLVHARTRINPYARRVHGITLSDLEGAPPLHTVCRAFEEFAHGCVLVEHSADGFDTRLVSTALGHPIDAPNVDTTRLAGRIWSLKDTIGLEKLCERLEVTHRHPHAALADAEATGECFVRLIQTARQSADCDFPLNTLADLLAVASPPAPAEAKEHPRRRRTHRGRLPAEPLHPHPRRD